MSQPTQHSALITRSGALWRTIDAGALAQRAHELAHALVGVAAPAGGVLALEYAAGAEALAFAVAGREAGLAIRLGPAHPPLAAALAATPARAAAIAAEAGIDQVAVPCSADADGARSLERLAAHGVLEAALRPEALTTRAPGPTAVIGADGTAFTPDQLDAAIAALRAIDGLLVADEPVLIALPLNQPWILAFALAALAVGAPVALGRLADAQVVRPGVIVASCVDVAALPDRAAPGSRLIAGLARLLGRDRTIPPARCLVVPDGFVDRDLCVDLALGGTTVLHAVGDPRLLVPAALNRPDRHRLDAYGLAVPHHEALTVGDRLVVRGTTAPDGVETAIGARLDGDVVLPAV